MSSMSTPRLSGTWTHCSNFNVHHLQSLVNHCLQADTLFVSEKVLLTWHCMQHSVEEHLTAMHSISHQQHHFLMLCQKGCWATVHEILTIPI